MGDWMSMWCGIWKKHEDLENASGCCNVHGCTVCTTVATSECICSLRLWCINDARLSQLVWKKIPGWSACCGMSYRDRNGVSSWHSRGIKSSSPSPIFSFNMMCHSYSMPQREKCTCLPTKRNNTGKVNLKIRKWK